VAGGNEHIPRIPDERPTLAWAIRFQRQSVASFGALAARMACDPLLAGVHAVGGSTMLISAGRGSGSEQLFRRLGFAILPHRNPLGQ
jgi:hypothetical protein